MAFSIPLESWLSGSNFEDTARKCPNCGNVLESGQRECHDCDEDAFEEPEAEPLDGDW